MKQSRVMEGKVIKAKAEEIAKIISEVNTDYRGNLLLEIAENLSKESQGFTSSLFHAMSQQYGINPKVK